MGNPRIEAILKLRRALWAANKTVVGVTKKDIDEALTALTELQKAETDYDVIVRNTIASFQKNGFLS